MHENRSTDLTELLRDAEKRGYGRNFAVEGDELCCSDTGERFGRDEARIVSSQAVDMGTDPGDDATLYLIETDSGAKGYVVISDAFHADPRKAAFIDSLERHSEDAAPES
ncbi:MAG TPA: hypothetical protein VE175_05735 [Woeseiaceae bacterium]|nr:hypothetical protein [Woeseiaceae bacterium]